MPQCKKGFDYTINIETRKNENTTGEPYKFTPQNTDFSLKLPKTSAWMLEHALQDNPSDIVRGNDSRIAYLINNDKNYLDALDKAISESKDGTIDTDLKNIRFKSGDLHFSIHKATIHVKGYRQDNGKWLVYAELDDIYNFDEIQSFMGEDGEFSFDVGLGTVANDVALGSQMLGAINPYHVTVQFYTTR